jgi:DNA repair exonuclease SbcCD ATPase subunit
MRAELTSMLVEVQRTESPKTIKAFLENIRGMMTKLQAEQAKHQEISDRMMKQCKEESAFRKKEIGDAKTALSKSRAARRLCRTSLKSSRKTLPELVSALRTYESELNKAIKQRAAEHKVYLIRKRDFEEAIAFVKDFIKYVSAKLKGSFKTFSFVEKSEQLLRHATKLGLLGEAVPVLVALATSSQAPAQNDYSYNANESIATKLKVTLNNLLLRIQGDWATNEQIERDAVVAFQKLKTRLEKAIATLKKNIERTKKQITAMEKCIVDETKVITSANGKFARNDRLKRSAETMCAQFASEFVHATNSRIEEISVIRQILVIIEKRFGQLPADLKMYLETVENGWVEYRNSTEFKAFVAYKIKHLKGSKHGRSLTWKKNMV